MNESYTSVIIRTVVWPTSLEINFELRPQMRPEVM